MILAWGLFTYITYRDGSPIMFIMWGMISISVMLGLTGTLNEAIVFILFILYIVVLMIAGVYRGVRR